uniref:V-type proton ATPase subunit C n=1 Tax=Xiphophorus couchianus TaxID=32473 RepID=A0A3B5LQM2_9TELE
LTWNMNTLELIKKAQQRLNFLRVLRRNNIKEKLLVSFYKCSIESILTYCICVWYNSSTTAQRKALQRVVNTAQKIIGCPLPSLEDLHSDRCLRKAQHITKDTSHPGPSLQLFEDNDSGLFSVTLFRKAVDDFRHKARENKFTVRDFQYNEEEMKADKEEMTRLSTDKKKQFGPLVRWLKVNFSEAFIAWIHIKALRVFVESVLRYGLPVNFQAMLLQPNKKNMKKLREVLNDLYKHLDSSAAVIDASMDIPGLNLSQQEYYPYVYYKIDCNLLDFKV